MSDIIKQSFTTRKHQRFSCGNNKIKGYGKPITTIVSASESEENQNRSKQWSESIVDMEVVLNPEKEEYYTTEEKEIKPEILSDKAARRRQIDPTTCERDYSSAEIEFMNALDTYKRTSGRMFPTCSEILEVFLSLGYVKRDTQSIENQLGDQESSPDAQPTTPAFAMEGRESRPESQRSLFSPYHDDQSTFLNF